ncbi:MAG: biotin--[acetyl-CoA-carboxylase] ligase [Acidobacteria bacterium]|nr:biotin--[acetyl-CoA-carboxylase] ligase [Acidobacteriota bacterium]
MSALGRPHLHLREAGSTNARARELAGAGAPHGTLVTASFQASGRGRQGRSWQAPPGQALLMSLVLREPSDLLPLAAGVAVARACGPEAQVKWPNDVVLAGPEGGLLKLAGILAEGRPQEGWAVLGIGLNVAVEIDELPDELRGSAATLGLPAAELPAVRDRVLAELEAVLALPDAELLEAWRGRDALLGRPVDTGEVTGVAAGVDGAGRLVVELEGGGRTALDAGEVHLGSG